MLTQIVNMIREFLEIEYFNQLRDDLELEGKAKTLVTFAQSKLLLVICLGFAVVYIPQELIMDRMVISLFICLLLVYVSLPDEDMIDSLVISVKNKGGKNLNRGRVLEREHENAKTLSKLFWHTVGLRFCLVWLGLGGIIERYGESINLMNVLNYSVSIEYAVVFLQSITIWVSAGVLYYLFVKCVLYGISAGLSLKYVRKEVSEIQD